MTPITPCFGKLAIGLQKLHHRLGEGNNTVQLNKLYRTTPFCFAMTILQERQYARLNVYINAARSVPGLICMAHARTRRYMHHSQAPCCRVGI